MPARLTRVTAEPLPLAEVVVRPVRGHHAFEACVEQLATAIRLGVYPFGSTLPPERELAERLEVSRATLREAMAALRTAGLVETRRGRGGGTVVTMKPQGPSARTADRTTAAQRKDWLDALSFRRIVEPGAAALAASRQLDDAGPGHLGGGAPGGRRRPPAAPGTGRPTRGSTSRSPHCRGRRGWSSRSPRSRPASTRC